MASELAIAEKGKVLGSIKEKLSSSIILFADFRGMTVSELTLLRREVKREGGSASVYKNTLTRKALDEMNISCPDDFLKGPSLFLSGQDPVVLSKLLVKFTKDVESLKIKGGFLDKSALDERKVVQLASLPSREELIAKVVGTIKAPLTRLVSSLSSPTRGLVYTLNAIKEKKQEVK